MLTKRRHAQSARSKAIDLLHQLAGDCRSGTGWTMTGTEVMSAVDTSKPAVIAAHNRYRQQTEALREVEAGMRQIRDAWNASRWNRYWMVDGGKIHAHDKCSMLNDRTILSLLFQHSGDTAEVVMVSFGPVLCGHCFPNAPRPTKRDVEACPGSGKKPDWMHEPCPDCGKRIARTSTGAIRRHRPS